MHPCLVPGSSVPLVLSRDAGGEVDVALSSNPVLSIATSTSA